MGRIARNRTKSRKQIYRQFEKHFKASQKNMPVVKPSTELASPSLLIDLETRISVSPSMPAGNVNECSTYLGIEEENIPQAMDFQHVACSPEYISEDLSLPADSFFNRNDPIDVPNSPADPNLSVISDIRIWAVEENVTVGSLRKLLRILKPLIPQLPLDPRTLLKHERIDPYLVTDSNEFYIYCGLEKGINHVLDKSEGNSFPNLRLSIHVDGLQIFKSTNEQLWPILCSIEKSSPFVVALFSGKRKPSIESYFAPFLEELNKLNNLTISTNRRYSFSVDLNKVIFICDAPAKSFIKGSKLHNSYYACERCVQKGQWKGRVIFSELESPLRTDETYRNRQDPLHHNTNQSPLEVLPIDMIHSFPFDYMHLVCLGVTRRLLNFWIKGRKNSNGRFSSHQKRMLEERMNAISEFIPDEFSRKPRGIGEIDRWKASEFRQFLLYTGPIVLKKLLNKEYYEHFLLLSVGIRYIVQCRKTDENIQVAERFLRKFVFDCVDLYGLEMCVYNVHSLIHICDDVRRYGGLENFSAFKFENHLGKLKRKIRSRRFVAKELANKLFKDDTFLIDKDEKNKKKLKGKHRDGPIIGDENVVQYRVFTWNSQKFDLSTRNSCLFMNDGRVFELRNILKTESGDIKLIGQTYYKYKTVFTNPIRSGSSQIYRVENLSNLMQIVPENIYSKCIRIVLDDKIYIMSFLHEL